MINQNLLKEVDRLYSNPDFQLQMDMNGKCRHNEMNDYYVPRVTVLLDTIKEDYLLQWANNLGWKHLSYTKTLQEYADLGTEVHEDIERYLKTGQTGMSAGFMSFQEWWTKFTTLNTVTDIESEVSMVCPYFSGTTDLFCKVNGRNCLVDFKTSKHINYKYIAQLAAYSYMMDTVLGRKIDYFIIFQVDKYEPGVYQAYMYDLNNDYIKNMFDHALEYIFHLACGYLHNKYLQDCFNTTERQVRTREAKKIC